MPRRPVHRIELLARCSARSCKDLLERRLAGRILVELVEGQRGLAIIDAAEAGRLMLIIRSLFCRFLAMS